MTTEQSASLLEGVYVANVTPFLDDDRYSIDARVYEAHVRWLADHGVTGIVPFGTNGEGPSIAAREKRPLFEALAAAADQHLPILHVVGGVGVRERGSRAVGLAHDARSQGAGF